MAINNLCLELSKLEQFMIVYEKNLALAVAKYPDQYYWPVSNVPVVASKMKQAIINKTFSHDSYAFKMTCKELSIKYTRKAILEFVFN